MMKKLISLSLIAVAALMIVAIPSAQGGKYSSYDTPWMITCSGLLGVPINISGFLYLTSKVVLGSGPGGCSSLDGSNQITSDILHTSGSPAPTTWTWSMPGCFNLHNGPISGRMGVSVPYNCFSPVDNTLVSSGSVFVGKPVGSTLP